MTIKKKFSATKFSIYTILTICKIVTIFNFIFCKYFLTIDVSWTSSGLSTKPVEYKVIPFVKLLIIFYSNKRRKVNSIK